MTKLNESLKETVNECEAKFERYLEFAPYSILIVNADGFITVANSLAEQTFQYQKDELLGIKIETLIPKRYMTDHASKRLQFSQHPETRPMRTGLDLYGLRKDGSEIPVDVSLSSVGTKDNPLIMCIVIDITERKKMESMLAAEKELLDVTLRSIGDAVITTDIDKKVVLMNRVAEELTGVSLEETLGQNIDDVFHLIEDETRQKQDSPIAEVLNKGVRCSIPSHTLLIANDGTERLIDDSASPIMDKDNNMLGVVMVFRDITEKSKLEEELAKIEKLQSVGVLAGGIAHDFNNILTGIIGNLSLASMYLEPKHSARNVIDKAEKASRRAQELTLQLLTFAKGSLPVKKTVQISELLMESVNFSLMGSKVKCDIDIAVDLYNLDVDEGQINQVINNLIINADQSMPQGGKVEVIAQNVEITEDSTIPLKPGNYVMLKIRDHGEGITEENMRKIFDPYFTTKQKGNGLGLATTLSIITKHNGHISVKSQIGKGTTFYIYLPASSNSREAVHEEGKLNDKFFPSDIPDNKGKILIMDNDENILDFAGLALSSIGYDVSFARKGEEAIDLYVGAKDSDNPYDAVILDLTIPGGMGGEETIEQLLELDPKVNAIVSSGYSDDPITANYHNYGFKGRLLKPYTANMLFAEITKIL